jgi:hypothetical protein
MATTLRLRDFLGRLLINATPGTTDPAKDYLGKNVQAANLDASGRGLIATLRANSTAYALGAYVQFASGQLYLVTVGGTSAASPPSESGIGYGQALVDGTVTYQRVF